MLKYINNLFLPPFLSLYGHVVGFQSYLIALKPVFAKTFEGLS